MSNAQSTENIETTDSDSDFGLEIQPEELAAAETSAGTDGTTPPRKPKRQTAAKAQPEVVINPASFADLRPQSNGRKEKASLDMLMDIGLQVTVELGRTKMSIRDVLAVGPGTVVELNRVAGEPVDILINGKPIAKGEVVVIGDMFGVRVTDILPPAQRVQSMI